MTAGYLPHGDKLPSAVSGPNRTIFLRMQNISHGAAKMLAPSWHGIVGGGRSLSFPSNSILSPIELLFIFQLIFSTAAMWLQGDRCGTQHCKKKSTSSLAFNDLDLTFITPAFLNGTYGTLWHLMVYDIYDMVLFFGLNPLPRFFTIPSSPFMSKPVCGPQL